MMSGGLRITSKRRVNTLSGEGRLMRKQRENDIERQPIKNFRELVKRYEKFGDKVAFKFKQAR